MSSVKDIAAVLKKQTSVCIASHVSPDADAVASSCGLALGLQKIGVQVCVYLQDGLPEKLKSFVRGVKVVTELPKESFSAVIGVDTAAAKRLGREFQALLKLGKEVIVIDHHVSNEKWGETNLVIPDASSTAEIIYDLLSELGVPFDIELANLLFAGILDDTGSFRFSNTTAKALRIAAELVEKGAEVEWISTNLNFSIPRRALELRTLALQTLEIHYNGKVGFLYVNNDMMKKTGALVEDTDGLVEEARSVQGTEVAVFMRELQDGWKLSLRSKSKDIDVNSVAGSFGGGGHRAAAGCMIKGNFFEAKEKVLAALKPFFS